MTASVDMQSYLQSELLRRTRVNPRYSLRAFAQQLQLEPSALSKILRGKRRITKPLFAKIVQRLKLSKQEIESLQAGEFQFLGQATPEYRRISQDAFQIISEWYHYAILEIIRIEGFQSSTKWISRTLGIKVSEAEAAVARLQRLGYLKINEDGTWIDCADSVTNFEEGLTSKAQRELQRGLLMKALETLESIPIAERSHTSMTMAVNIEKLPEARELIRKFRRQLNKFLSSAPPYQEVYNLSVALYPLTRGRDQK